MENEFPNAPDEELAEDADPLVQEETEAAAAEAGAIGGRAPDGDEAERPVREAGGGEAEGFEQAEADLIDEAEHGHRHDPESDRQLIADEARREGRADGEADEPRAAPRH